MIKEYDPYFANFLEDIGYGLSLVFQAVELFIGVSYLIGSKVVLAALWLFRSSFVAYEELAVCGNIVVVEVAEFAASFMRAVLLIFYGAGKIGESFYITAVDLQSLYYHVKESLERTASQTGAFIYGCLTGIFTQVPQQLVSALSMIGESSLMLKDGVINIAVDFVSQLFWSPVNVVIFVGKCAFNLLCIPVDVIRNMPPVSLLGLIVLVTAIFVFRRLLRYFILTNVLKLFNALLDLILRVLSFIRVNKLKRVVTYSVSAISHLRDSVGSGGSSCKAICVICQDKPVSFMSNPCKHVCLCEICVEALLQHDNKCPICRRRVTRYDRVFIP